MTLRFALLTALQSPVQLSSECSTRSNASVAGPTTTTTSTAPSAWISARPSAPEPRTSSAVARTPWRCENSTGGSTADSAPVEYCQLLSTAVPVKSLGTTRLELVISCAYHSPWRLCPDWDRYFGLAHAGTIGTSPPQVEGTQEFFGSGVARHPLGICEEQNSASYPIPPPRPNPGGAPSWLCRNARVNGYKKDYGHAEKLSSPFPPPMYVLLRPCLTTPPPTARYRSHVPLETPLPPDPTASRCTPSVKAFPRHLLLSET